MIKKHYLEKIIREFIKECQNKDHIQQVAFSTFHNSITQVCFTCDVCRTSIKESDLK